MLPRLGMVAPVAVVACLSPPDPDPDAARCETGQPLLSETFSELDPEDWMTEGYGGAQVRAERGALRIVAPDPDSGGKALSSFVGPLRDASIAIEVPAPGDVSSNHIKVALLDADGQTAFVGMERDVFMLGAWVDLDNDVPSSLALIDYERDGHRHWRLSESGGEVIAETSPDGSDWTEIGVRGSSSGIPTRMRIELSADNYAGALEDLRFESILWCGEE